MNPVQQSEEVGKSTLSYPSDWSIFSRHLTIIVLLVGLVFGVTLIRPVMTYVIMAAILVFILYYPVHKIETRTRLSHSAATAIIFGLYLVVGIVLFVFLVIPAIQGVVRLATELSMELPAFADFLEDYNPEQGWLLDPETGEKLINLDFALEPLSRYVQGEEVEEVNRAIDTLADLIPQVVGGVTNFITGSIVVHVMAFFFLLELPTLYTSLIGQISPQHRPEYQILTRRVILVWINFFRGTVASAALIATLSLIQFLIMGLPAALALSLMIFVTSLIPLVGGFIALPILIFVTFSQGSSTLGLEPIPLTILVLVIHFLISQFVWQVVYPKLTGKALNLPVSLVIVGLAAGAAIGGFLGVLLAAPTLGSVRQIVDFLIRKIRGGNPYPEESITNWQM
ncbi:MAG: AI-2E family transporter [Anaerolineae bacterium]|nr:AI-2E family transporter [Anaerolineae bacterium]